MPNGDEQQEEKEEDKGMARQLAEEKAKEVLKKAVVEPAKKVAKAAAKKAVLFLGKISLAALKIIGGFLVANPISLVIILSILVIIIILVAIQGEGVENRCDEIIWTQQNDPAAYQMMKEVAEEYKIDWTACTEEQYVRETKTIRPEPTEMEVQQTQTQAKIRGRETGGGPAP